LPAKAALLDETSGNAETQMSQTRGQRKGNNMKIYGKISVAAAALVVLGIGGLRMRGDDGEQSNGRWKQLVIDVANDARTSALIQVNAADTLPKRGATFIVNGRIFPGGTIPTGNGFDIDSTGGIGTSVTRATFNFDANQQFTGGDPLLTSTQDYLFSPAGALNGEDSLMSGGQESIIASTHRVVLGGTGIYRGTIGEVKQEVLGANNTGFLNFRFTFTIRTPE
jgi:hypothetical protein